MDAAAPPIPPPPASPRRSVLGLALAAMGICLGVLLAAHVAMHTVIARRAIATLREDCRHNLRNLAAAAQLYADEHRSFPWPRGVTPGAAREEDACEVFATLCREGYLDSPALLVCRASPDEPAGSLETGERRRTFHLDATACSYTWTRRAGGSQDTSAPLAGDRCGPDGRSRNVDDHWHVVFRGGQIRRFTSEELADPDDPVARRIREDLIGYDRIVVRAR